MGAYKSARREVRAKRVIQGGCHEDILE